MSPDTPPPRPWPQLALATAILLGAGGRAHLEGAADGITGAGIAAGMIVLGVWLALEVQHYSQRRRRKD